MMIEHLIVFGIKLLMLGMVIMLLLVLAAALNSVINWFINGLNQ